MSTRTTKPQARASLIVFDPTRPRAAAPRRMTPREISETAATTAITITSIDPLFPLISAFRLLTPEVRDLFAEYLAVRGRREA